MKILSWNCQGLGNPLTVQEIRALTAQERPTMVFLMETKNKETVVEKTKRRLKFQHVFTEQPIGIAGGLVLMWNEEAEVKIISSSKEYIDVECKDPSSGHIMEITFVHAPTTLSERLLLWQKLRELHSDNHHPWLCVGDFNEILYSWEKVGKREADQHRIAAFRELLNDCSLMDIDTKGCAFTWANNRDGENLVKKRLDRALCTMEWRITFQMLKWWLSQ